MSEYRGDFLARLINDHHFQRYAELGLWKGRTFFHILDNCPSITEAIGVDEWRYCFDRKNIPGGQTYEKWCMPGLEKHVTDNAKSYGARAQVIKAETAGAAARFPDASFDVVFVDADHSEIGARRDIMAWLPKVRKGGFITGHDVVGEWEPYIVPVLNELLPGWQKNGNHTDAVWFIAV